MNPWANHPWQKNPPWYPNAHPHVYAPPPPGYPPAGYWEQYPWNRPADFSPQPKYNEFRSSNYPNLNPILAADTSLVRFDVRKKPQNDIQATTYYANYKVIATANSSTHIRLYSKAFPWSIDIKSTTPITCEAVWDAIHAALQEPIVDSEWGLIVGDKDRKKIVETAASSREGIDKQMKRIDWLGEHILFKGLEQDDEFQKARLQPGKPSCPDTYLVKLEKPTIKH